MWHTTCSRINIRKQSFITEPSNILRAMMPSVVNAGRTEYQVPLRKAALHAQGDPTMDLPNRHWMVWSSTALSSKAMKTLGSSYCSMSASHMPHNSSSHSDATLCRCFCVSLYRASSWEMVAIERWLFRTDNNWDCNSSRYRTGLASRRYMYLISASSTADGWPVWELNRLLTWPKSQWFRMTFEICLIKQFARTDISR